MPLDRPTNDLADWYPLLAQAGVPTPATAVISTDLDLSPLLDGVNPDGISTLVEQITDAAGRVGFPAFLRTGHTAAKHDFARTCFLRTPADVLPRLAALVTASALADLPTNTWAVRELLPLQPAFLAYRRMPVTAERRYYFNALGQVIGHHPYWSPDALAQGNPRGPHGPLEPDAWQPVLDALNAESDEEIAALTALTERVAAVVPGAWSVDYLWAGAQRGWVLIDMTHLEDTEVWHAHPSAPFMLGRPLPEPTGPIGPGVGGAAGPVEAALLAESGWAA